MSKRVFQHPAPPTTGKKYWRSLGELGDTPEFRGWLEREFPQGAAEFQGGDVSRRNFLQLMGASMALAGFGLTGCRRMEKHLVPFTRGVEWSIPGKTLFFSTSYPTRKGAAPLVVATHDGRPTKIEGNPLHPASKGASDLLAQSSILDLYDPDRSKHFLEKGKRSDEAAFLKALDAAVKGAGDGGGLAFLVETNHSPTRERLRAEVERKFPKATWAVYEPLGDEPGAAVYDGVRALPKLEKAAVILSIDSDFLGNDGDVALSKAFSAGRKADGPDAKMNRLYSVENRYTVTGGIADHRLRLPASQMGAFARALAEKIQQETKDAGVLQLLQAMPAGSVKFPAGWVEEAAADLVANKGQAVVLVGPRQPVGVQALGAAINAMLGAPTKTLVGRSSGVKPGKSIVDLARQIKDKQVQALVILGGNPAYNAPADLAWTELQSSVPTVIRLGLYEDETSKLATWHIPAAHYLETWGDGRAIDGSYTSVQPMILPLYGGWSELDLLAVLSGGKKTEGPELVQETFRQVVKPGNFPEAWAKFLHDGFVAGETPKDELLSFNGAFATEAVKKLTGDAPTEKGLEVVFIACPKVDDGRFNNNGWLQEIPDPMTKLTWDNAALLSPATARQLGVKDGGMLEITVNKATVTIPALRFPGHADNSISIALGYGRTEIGRVGKGTGFNAYPLRTTETPYFALGATAKATGKTHKLAVTQEHGTLEGRGPDLTRQANLEDFKAHPDSIKKSGMDAHIPPNVSLYANPPLADLHQWAMTVDMSVCNGCSACMVACQAENNIPIVGKEQVINGREMHWIRCDRYFASLTDEEGDPEVISQPMMCQHCESAPCETVCPVNATVHSEDGLNVMAYNRCIGTRYCANNCPFKVRRFNFFDYNQRDVLGTKPDEAFSGVKKWNLIAPKGMEDSLKMSKNPNVTVRMRGVMEKCTFCVQRIQEAKIAAKVSGRDSTEVKDIKIPADAFTSACAQACPSDAIVFGDKSNPESSVSKLMAKERSYRLLEYLNIGPRVMYLARIKNPNPKMPGFDKIGEAMKSHHHGPSHEGAAPAAGGHH
jgi:molybdopterin-containing oxidoreductase family iron-sulfur binding subunit